MTSLQKENIHWLALSWAPYSRMSQTFARELGGKLHCIHYLRFQSPPHAPLKYILQAIRTLVVLFKERPRAIHVQTPPFVAGLVVDLYCRLTGAKFECCFRAYLGLGLAFPEIHRTASNHEYRYKQPLG